MEMKEVIKHLFTEPLENNYKENIENILELYFVQNPNALKDWSNWFERK